MVAPWFSTLLYYCPARCRASRHPSAAESFDNLLRVSATPGVARIKLQPSEAAERLLQGVAPQQAGALGVVLFNVLIGTDGHVQQAVAINRTSPYIAEAAQAVMQWIYRPATVNENPAEAVSVVPVPVPAK